MTLRTWSVALSFAVAAAAQSPFLHPLLRDRYDVESFRTIAADAARLRGDFVWESRQLVDVIGDLRRRLGRTILLASTLEARRDEPVTLELHDVSFMTACRVLCEVVRARFVFEDGILRLTTPDDAERRLVELRIYDVAELLYAPPDFPAPELGIHPGKPTTSTFEIENTEHRSGAEIVELLRSILGEEAWRLDTTSIVVSGRMLAVRQTPENHAKIKHLIDALTSF